MTNPNQIRLLVSDLIVRVLNGGTVSDDELRSVAYGVHYYQPYFGEGGLTPENCDRYREIQSEFVQRLRALEKETTRNYRCARCGDPAKWVSGAAEALCERHEDDY